MDNHANAGMLAACSRHLLWREALVDGAVALPQDDARIPNCFGGIPAKLLVRVPDNHLVEGDAHAVAGVAAKMLVGEEQGLFTVFKGPFHDGSGVGAGADRAAMLSGERFDRSRGVHVADRNSLAGVHNGGKFVPASLDL